MPNCEYGIEKCPIEAVVERKEPLVQQREIMENLLDGAKDEATRELLQQDIDALDEQLETLDLERQIIPPCRVCLYQ